MSDTIIDQIKAAQAAPADTYMVWAEVNAVGKTLEIVLHSVRLPQSLEPDGILSRTRKMSDEALADCGFSPAEVAGATLYVTALPSAEVTIQMLKA